MFYVYNILEIRLHCFQPNFTQILNSCYYVEIKNKIYAQASYYDAASSTSNHGVNKKRYYVNEQQRTTGQLISHN